MKPRAESSTPSIRTFAAPHPRHSSNVLILNGFRPFLCVLLLGLVAACTQSRDGTVLNQDDVKALTQIYGANPAIFKQHRLRIHARTDGAVELNIQGDVVGRAGDAVAPARADGPPRTVRDGETLWLPTVLMRELPPYFTASSGPNRTPVELQAYKVDGGLWCITALIELPPTVTSHRGPLDLNVLLVSPAFVSTLPMAVPLSQASGVVDVSLTLPDRARLLSSGILAAEQRTSALSNLTLLPTSISDRGVHAATRLSTRTSIAWDLSHVRYEPPPPAYGYLRRFWVVWALPLVWALVIVYAEFLWRLGLERSESPFNVTDAESSQQSHDPQISGVYPKALPHSVRRPLYLRSLYWSGAVAGILSLMGLLATLAFGQPKPAETATVLTTPSGHSLGDLGLRADPLDGKSDRMALTLSFVALASADGSARNADVTIGVGQNSRAQIVEIRKKPEGTRGSSYKRVWLTVPATVSPGQGLLSALAGTKVTQYSVTDGYLNSISAGQVVWLEYIISGAHALTDWVWDGRLHLFPLESRSIEIPLEFSQPALLSKVELLKVPDFAGQVSFLGLGKTPIETSTAYQLVYENQDNRPIIAANRVVTVGAHLRRTLFQRGLLTIGQFLMALVFGVVLGFVATMPDKSPTRWIIQISGGLLVPLTFRSAVFVVYKDLPLLWVGQPPTIFEISFIVSAVSFISVSLIVASVIQKRRAKTAFGI